MHIEEIIIVLMLIRSITINKCLKNNEQVIKTYKLTNLHNIIYPVYTILYIRFTQYYISGLHNIIYPVYKIFYIRFTQYYISGLHNIIYPVYTILYIRFTKYSISGLHNIIYPVYTNQIKSQRAGMTMGSTQYYISGLHFSILKCIR